MVHQVTDNWNITEINKAYHPLTALRSFTKVPFAVSRGIQRNVATLEAIRKPFQEELDAMNKRLEDEVTFVNNVPSDKKKFDDYKQEVKNLMEEKHTLSIFLFSDADFPQTPTDFGEKEIALQDGRMQTVSYLEEYLKLLDFVIIDKEEINNVVTRSNQVQAVKEEPKTPMAVVNKEPVHA